MKREIILILFTSIFFQIGCRESYIEPILLSPEKSVSEISDSIFLDVVGNIQYFKDLIYISSPRQRRLIVCDKDLKLVKFVGNPGRGPNEIITSYGFFVDSNGLISISKSDGFKTFEFSGVEKSDLKFEQIDETAKFYVTSNGEYIYSSIGTNQPITFCFYDKLNNKNVIRHIGENFNQPGSPIQIRRQNVKDIFVINNSLIVSIGSYFPLIEIYDFNGNLLSSQILRDSPIYEKLNHVREVEKTEPNTLIELFLDLCLDNTDLYLLLYNLPPSKREKQRCFLVKYSLESLKFKLNKIYELKNDESSSGTFTNFCIIDHASILAYESFSGKFHYFKIQ